MTPEPKEKSEPPPAPEEGEEDGEKPLPKFFDKPKILAYPNRAAKSGKFDCSVKSLHALLGYKSDDLKESTFEISLFAELFHERIMRDQGFKIYQSISRLVLFRWSRLGGTESGCLTYKICFYHKIPLI